MAMRQASPIGPFPGLLRFGNIDLANRPVVQNPDGTVSTVRSMSFGTDGGEVLVPTVSPSGTILTDQGAENLYASTGRNLGTFDTPEHADMYAQALHKAQEQYYTKKDGGMAGMTLEQQRAEAEADAARRADEARVQGYVDKAKQRVQSGDMSDMPAADPNTGQPVGVPAYSPVNYDRLGSGIAGAENAMTFGFGDELGSYLGSALTGIPRKQVLEEMRAMDSKAQSENPGSYLGGQIAGGLAQGVATGGAGFGLNAARTGGTLGRVALGTALDSGIYGGLLGAGNANGDSADRAKGAGIGGAIGFGTGFGAPYLTAGVSQGVRRLISPFASSPEREAAVNLLAQEGVPVTAGQRTGSNALRYAESELGGSKAAGMMDQQAEAFTDAAMRKAGGSGRATPDNLASLKSGLGQQFDDISARNTMVADNQLAKEVGDTFKRYDRLLETQQKPIIRGILGDLVERVNANGGNLSGVEYQAIRSDLTRAASSTSNQTLGAAFRGIRNALDDAMERSINPADLGAWKVLRKQYGNYKVLNRASSGGGEAAGLGLISPAQLRTAAATGNREGFANGASDFTGLAKAGQAVMTPLPNSGTAARSAVRNLGVPLGTAGVGSMVAGIPGAVAGAALPYAAGRTLMWGPVQRYLGNQAATGSGNKVAQAYIAALLRAAGVPAINGASN